MDVLRYLLAALLLLPAIASAQVFSFDEVPVVVGEEQLPLAWSGGINTGQYSMMDLDGDEDEDLVIFDRVATRILTFTWENGRYQFDPNYSQLFPENIRNWMLLRDFNGDGLKDLFVSDPFGMAVYVNETEVPGELKWRPFNLREGNGFRHLLTEGSSGQVNLQLNATDLPAIDDLDGDGDLDILVFRFSGASTIEFHKNMSVENDGNLDSLQYERVTQNYGLIEECDCGDIALGGDSCADTGGRSQHAGGKAILTLDYDADGDKDLVISEEQCNEMSLLINSGTSESPIFNSLTTNFPSSTDPVNLSVYPAAYLEDVNHDGHPDLVIAPNITSSLAGTVDFGSSSFVHLHNGNAENPEWLNSEVFLQNEMIDIGEQASIAFTDIEGDGDEDMIVANPNALLNPFTAATNLYENVGSLSMPSFEFRGSLPLPIITNLFNVKIYFEDIDVDGDDDLVFSGTDDDTFTLKFYYIPNIAERGLELEDRLVEVMVINSTPSLNSGDNLGFHDISGDGLPDLLLGRSTGNLVYYRNTGTAETPSFTQESDAFYGIGISPFTVFPKATFGDFDGNGETDMIVGDATGNLTLYRDFKRHLNNPLPGETAIIQTNIAETPGSYRFGADLFPLAVNLYNADRPSLMIGTAGGGVLLLRNQSGQNVEINEGLIAYPNPVVRGNLLTLRTGENTALVTLYNSKGQKTRDTFFMEPNSIETINTRPLAPGLFIIRIETSTQIYSNKIVVYE